MCQTTSLSKSLPDDSTILSRCRASKPQKLVFALFDVDLTIWAEEAKSGQNPYLAEWYEIALENQMPSILKEPEAYSRRLDELIKSGRYGGEIRRGLVKKYSWAIPCEAALQALAKLSPLIEIGAGVGYWAYLLRKRGVDIVAYDLHPTNLGKNHYHSTCESWTEVCKGDWRVLKKHPERSLFLCWPPHNNPMAYRCLKAYKGENVVFVGEDSGGCTGCDRFFGLLESDFELFDTVAIPQWRCLHDAMWIYKRK